MLDPNSIATLIQFVADALDLHGNPITHFNMMVWGKFRTIDPETNQPTGPVTTTRNQPYSVNHWGPFNRCVLNNGIGGSIVCMCDELYGVEMIVADTSSPLFAPLRGKRNTERQN